MNISAIVGIALTAAALCLAILVQSPLAMFFDLGSVLIVGLSLPAILMLTHGAGDVYNYGVGGLIRYLFPATDTEWGPAQRMKAARIANSVGIQAIMLGVAGTLIGVIQMLQNLEDPTKIGPALAVAGLTVIYGLGINVLICSPLAQHHQLIALDAGASLADLDSDRPIRTIIMLIALIGLSVGMSFLVMLLAMASWLG